MSEQYQMPDKHTHQNEKDAGRKHERRTGQQLASSLARLSDLWARVNVCALNLRLLEVWTGLIGATSYSH